MGGEPGNRDAPFLIERLKTDPLALAEMKAARAWSVPRSVFRHQWLDADREWALALMAFEAGKCPGCGQPTIEAHAAENEDAYDAHPIRCHGCATAAKATKQIPDQAGLYVITTKREVES